MSALTRIVRVSFRCIFYSACAAFFGWFLHRHFGFIGWIVGLPAGFLFGVRLALWPLRWIERALHPLKFGNAGGSAGNVGGFASPEALHHFMFRRKGWQGTDDKSLFPFRCPACRRIYVLDEDAENVFLNADNLAERSSVAEKFACVGCGEILRDRSRDLDRIFKDECLVPFPELETGAWRWGVKTPGWEDDQYYYYD